MGTEDERLSDGDSRLISKDENDDPLARVGVGAKKGPVAGNDRGRLGFTVTGMRLKARVGMRPSPTKGEVW
jgi:hypothetical protein